MQAQKVEKGEENAITLDEGRAEFFAKLEEECEAIREDMRKKGES